MRGAAVGLLALVGGAARGQAPQGDERAPPPVGGECCCGAQCGGERVPAPPRAESPCGQGIGRVTVENRPDGAVIRIVGDGAAEVARIQQQAARLGQCLK